MSYTSTDLTNIESAILALATGTRKVRATIGDKTFEFAETDLGELRVLKSEIEASLGNLSLRTYAKNGGRGKWDS